MTTPTSPNASSGSLGFWLYDGEITAAGKRWLKTGLWIRAAVSIIVGIIILILAFNNPDAIAWTIALFFAIYFWVVGVVRIVSGIINKSFTPGIRVLNILLGVLLIVGGIVAIRNPVVALAALGLVIGFLWIFEGIMAISETAKDSSKWIGTILGVVSLIAGIVVIFLPLQTIGILVLFGSIMLIVTGIMAGITALMLGRGGSPKSSTTTGAASPAV
jgi:uncharacterized membrane protein HdeD (DUF308 family)